MGQFEGESALPEPYNEQEVDILRGKSLLMGEAGKDIRTLCRMIDWFTEKLDECDCDDWFGSEGWRNYFRIED